GYIDQPVIDLPWLRRLDGRESKRSVGIRHDGGQRLIDFVGDRRGHLPEGRDPQRMRQLVTLAQRLPLGLPPTGLALPYDALRPAARQNVREDAREQL